MIKYFFIHDFLISKDNWVDDKNNFVGFDASRDCCEEFGFYYIQDISKLENTDIEDYKMNDYENNIYDIIESGDNNFEFGECVEWGGGWVSVELLENNKIACYLVLYNIHDGYYSHNIDVSINGSKKNIDL